MNLGVAVSHGRKHRADIRILVIGVFDGSGGMWFRIDNLGGAIHFSGNDAGAVRHSAVGQGGSVFDHQNTLSFNLPGIVHQDSRFRKNNFSTGRMGFNISAYRFYLVRGCAVHFVDHRNIRHEHVGFSGIVEQFVASSVGVENHNVHVRIIKRRVVVSTVPHNDIRFFFR